jgi:hypothetical protein
MVIVNRFQAVSNSVVWDTEESRSGGRRLVESQRAD